MILFCGIPSEPPLAMAIDAARRRDLPMFVLNQRTLPHCDIDVRVENGRASGTLWADERAWPLEAFDGIYTRLIDSQDLPEMRRSHADDVASRAARKAVFVQETLNAWIEVAEARVVNRTAPSSTNGSKPLQAQLIREAGFSIPETLITNEPSEVAAFVRRHRRVVYKSISSVRSIVRELGPDDLETLYRVRDLPTQFQAYVPGTDVRVHVVGDELFAVAIHSQATDYRYADRGGFDVRMEPFELPPDVADRCRLLSCSLELPFCGIDLRVTDGRWCCFEVNPSPAYSYYEMSGRPSIADALVTYLAGADAAGRAG